MSLKRKASISGLASPSPAPILAGQSFMSDDTPKHLHSRTRKRFRNDRPDDEVVYENTLRWLFTAQQHQASTPATNEEAEPEHVPSPEIVDPRQQTLLKFFRPSQSFASNRLNKLDQQTKNIAQEKPTSWQSQNLNFSSPATSVGWSTSSPSSQPTSSDMDMDSARNEPYQDLQRSITGFGWA
ncbi:hypothetical protein BO94DRAFT_626579 [Aspergillus sclerotioniger CBS 115572]|uniref:Uncharacterized protein n=1 Tax=Aspergillus sclerotioniger CBS 115572 TaxID=1450535 RepID=A0A317VVY8_9EURO|nr:hypothetical protein BO94DRAFT_626579 [Aspergillus sclerotioniger CBS 115572]PWY78556.1 hypothetical protein BO94DRAFT_626579 [Aspergillus sclerotioniger CBS 115572]